MFLRAAAILLLTVVSSSGDSVPEFEDCGSTVGAINYIDITPCNSDVRCAIPRGINASLSVTYTAKGQITSAKTFIWGIIDNTLFPFPVPPDACQYMKCPLQNGDSAAYNNTFFVSEAFPKINVTAKFQLVDQLDRRIICFTVPIQVLW
ncbi:NPC intracellular cholesterol transporter 2-like [Haliotis rubra]|uniref:NPC intracellular cholesterol transporter 2-like n=1 Tax=Haliotis rubra TaxID=36100 RepID=UPI001EE58EC9|nr:NPC intracellular cholesterol transporter 2-like [Haliotis rubra]